MLRFSTLSVSELEITPGGSSRIDLKFEASAEDVIGSLDSHERNQLIEAIFDVDGADAFDSVIDRLVTEE